MAQSEVALAPRFIPDPWLAKSLGRSVYRVVSLPGSQCEQSLCADMARLCEHGESFFYTRLATSEIRTCIALGHCGFNIVDTAITLSRGTEGGHAPTESICVHTAARDEHDAILAVAAKCFRWSRFHLDPHIPREVADALKRRWVESYTDGTRGSALYAASVAGQVGGFLAVMESVEKGRRVAIIDLMGVAEEHQGKGVGRALVETFIEEWRGRASELRVGTQAANVRSLRLYESNGFRIASSQYVLHAHYGPRGSQR